MVTPIEARQVIDTAAEIGIAQKVKQSNENVLFVRRTDADCKESAEIINNLVGAKVALDYNNKTIERHQITKTQKTFPNLKVLIITHQKYRELSRNKSQRNIFTQGRSTLVIDEFISDIQKLSLSIVDIETYKAFFKRDNILYELYLRIVADLEDYLIKPDTDKTFAIITRNNIKKNIPLLIKYIKHNLTDDDLKQAAVLLENNEKIKTVKQLCNQIENINEFYQKPCFVRNKSFYTADSRCKNWLLDNNILLDANGELEAAYNFQTEFYKLKYCQKVLDHSHWRLHNIIINSTTSGKTRVENFYEIVNEVIEKIGIDNTLVVGSQADLPFLHCKHKAYFGNLIGSNKWTSLKNVVIAQTPNIDDVDYIIKYLFYSTDCMTQTFAKATTKSTGRNMLTRYSFTDGIYEKIRCLWISSEIYQACKRVNRDMRHATQAVIFLNNDDVIEMLKTKLVGCEVVTSINDKFRYKRNKRDEYIDELQKNSYAKKFISLLAQLQNGEHQELLYHDKKGDVIIGTYTKKSVREFLGISNKTLFSNQVLSKTDVINYCNTRGIITNGQYIKLGVGNVS